MSDYSERRRKAKLNASSVVYAAKVVLGTSQEPDPKYVLGLDPSHWSGIIDWQKAKSAGIRFAYIKFMDGVVKTRFSEENYKGAKDAGVLVSGYHWLRHHDEVSPGRQAREFAAMLKDHPVDFRPVEDYEWSPAGKKLNPGIGDLYGFVAPFADLYGKEPMLYTAPGYWAQYGSLNTYWTRLPLVVAQYRVMWPSRIQPWDSPYGLSWQVWQWTDQGDAQKFGFPVSGERRCTLNYLRFGLEELRRL